jgi:hypothetical protein
MIDAHRPWRRVTVSERRTALDYAERLREFGDLERPLFMQGSMSGLTQSAHRLLRACR